MRLHRRGWTSCGVVLPFILSAALAAGCGAASDGGSDGGDWYYHWSCNGDLECLSLNPTGAPSGTRNQGPVLVNCTQLMEFAKRFWNMPPATDSCDHSPVTPPPPPPIPGISSFVPTSGIQGTSVTLSGSGFPDQISGISVKLGGVGGVEAVVTSVTSNQVVFNVPALVPGAYQVTVTTAGGVRTAMRTFLVRDPILTVNASGAGSVVSAPAGISCNGGMGSCSASFPFGTAIALTESHPTSAIFNGWMGGGCSGTGPGCAFALDADLTVTASFESETLTVHVTGNGNVTSNPAGIDCGGGKTLCSASFLPGTTVTLTETPGAAASFGGWSGGTCPAASTTCTLTLDANATIDAPFLTYTLTVVPVALNGTTGTGTVTSVPAGIACVGVGAGATGCTAQFAGNTTVTLTAAPSGGSSFVGWGGAGCSGSGPCSLTLDAHTTVTGQYCVPHASLVFTTPGAFDFVACTDTIAVQVWGGGGGGGGKAGPEGYQGGGSGGGGGGYGTASVTVATGSSHTITVGAGGTKGIGYHASPYGELATAGGDGGTSSLGSLVSATGGRGGALGHSAGGAGGTSAATVNAAGTPGQAGSSSYPAGGGAGGAGGNGGAGGAGGLGVPYDTQPPEGSSPNGTAGTAPGGGGGGGGWQNFYAYDGAKGGDGKVIVTW